MMKRLLSLLLCLVMVLSMVPVQTIAQETAEEAMELISETEAVELETEPTEEETSAPTEAVTEPVEETTAPTEVAEEVVAETTGSDVAMGAVASGTCGPNLRWVLDDAGILTISGTGKMNDWTIFSSAPWSSKASSIKNVVTEPGVTNIGAYAFKACSNLSNVILVDSITEIRNGAFLNCTKLSHIILPDSITSIQAYAFQGAGLVSIELPNNHTNLEHSVFSNCKILESVSLPNNLTAIPNSFFQNCSSLSSISMPDSITNIGSWAFYGCTNLSEIVLPKSITVIEDNIFNSCTSLNNITLPENVTTIESKAFYKCTGLTSIFLPKSLINIGNDAFQMCNFLTDVYYSGTEEEWQILLDNAENGNYPLSDRSLTVHYNWTGENIAPDAPEAPEETTLSGTCGDNATWTFDQQTGVLTISGLGGIKNYKDPRDIYAYGDDLAPWNSFSSQIKEIKIESPISSIGDYAFSECSAVRILRLPVSVKSVGRYAFRSAGYLTDIYYEGTDAQWRTLCSNLKTGNTPLSGTSVTLHTNWKEPVDTVSGSCGDNVVWILNLTTGELKISGSGPMHNYWGAPGQYQPEPNYTPWCDYYLSIESVIIEPGVTSIGSYSFARCSKLVEVTIPDTVESIGHYAFDSCVNLSDVYYAGSEEQWNQIEISETGNDPLRNSSSVTIWYNWTGEAPEPVYLQNVLYYHSWDKTANKIYFGADAEVSFQVTEETDVSSITDLKLNHYVVVQTRKEGDQEILLKMELPKTAVGTVTAVNKSQITIDGETFTTPADLTSRESYLNTQVVYHVYYSNLAGIEILNNRRGYLTRWNSGDRELRIQTSATSNDPKFYRLAIQAEEGSKGFLNLSVNESGQTDVPVNYLVDNNRIIYKIMPCIEEREGGFSENKHGWPIKNDKTSFGYTTGYYIDPALYYAHGLGVASVLKKWQEGGSLWGGSCFGLSLLALAQYNGQVDLSPYFNNYGSVLNEFGYDSIVSPNSGDRFVLYHTEDDGKIVYNEEMIRKIEQAHLSQWSPEIYGLEEYWGLGRILNYFQKDDPQPMLISMEWDNKYAHAVVSDTSIKPIYIGNEQYLIPLYDCNAPQAPVELENPWRFYNYPQSMLYINIKENKWGYIFNNEFECKTNFSVFSEELSVCDIRKLDQSFFDDHYKLQFDPNRTTLIFNAKEFEIILDSENGIKTTVFEYINKPITYAGDVTFIPCNDDTEEKDVNQGCVILPKGNYIVKTKGESYVQYMYDDDIFVYGSDRDTEAMVDTQKDEMTVKNLGEESEVQCIYASSKVDFCTGVEARLSSGKSASLRTNSANKTASVATSAGAGSVTVTHVVDGEEVENTSDMIHYHDELTVLEGFEATCTETGLTDGRKCSSCGEITVPQQVIAATGHNYQNGACAKCGAIEYTYGQNVQIKLIEPWGIRANAKISTSAGVLDYSSLYDYGVYFIRKSALDRTGLTQSTITVADILNDTDARKMTKADGVTVSSGYLSAIYDNDIYTYELNDSVFVMFYFITEEGADPIYVPVRERNLKDLAQQRMNDSTNFPNELERTVYQKMTKLETDVTDYRSDFANLSAPEKQKAPTLAQHPLGAAAAGSQYTYGQNAQIKLIEPWGLKANVKVSKSGSVINYNAVEEYGIVALADNSKVYNTAAEILQNENAYVFSSKNGDASISNGYISATYSKDIFTYQLDTDIYVFGYVKDADGYHYGPVRNRNVHTLMEARMNDAVNFPNVKERTVYTDMIELFEVITAYREDYFKN